MRPQEVDFGKVEAVYDRQIDETFLAASPGPSPEKLVMDGVLDGEIQEALAELTEEYRSVVVMALMEEMSYKEISAALSIPLGTVMSRLHRGRKQLQSALLTLATRKGIVRGGSGVAKEDEG